MIKIGYLVAAVLVVVACYLNRRFLRNLERDIMAVEEYKDYLEKKNDAAEKRNDLIYDRYKHIINLIEGDACGQEKERSV